MPHGYQKKGNMGPITFRMDEHAKSKYRKGRKKMKRIGNPSGKRY